MLVQFLEKICKKNFLASGPKKWLSPFGANFEILNGHKMGSMGPFWVIQGASIWFLSVFNAMESNKNGFGTEKISLFLPFFGPPTRKKNP